MIKSNELRLGNLVEYKIHGKDEWVVAPVFSLNMDSGEFLRPVPLTPELLVKCGFELTYNKTNHKRCEISVGEDGFKLEFNWRKEALAWTEFKITGNGGYDEGGEMSINETCKYLHQLQNLYFTLTGTELNIQL
jgi:hypothetical protein